MIKYLCLALAFVICFSFTNYALADDIEGGIGHTDGDIEGGIGHTDGEIEGGTGHTDGEIEGGAGYRD